MTEEIFAIMPISDPEGYEKGHFLNVYKNIIKPACEVSGYKVVRADDVQQTSMIHLEIIRKIVEAPMAICDLSSRNPNVLFELGIRQAFDKPVVLIQEEGTPKIFDISPLKYTEYKRDMKYHDVIKSQAEIGESISATALAHKEKSGINSIVKLLALSRPAEISKNQKEPDPNLQFLRAEIDNLRTEIRRSLKEMVNMSSMKLYKKEEYYEEAQENEVIFIKAMRIIEDVAGRFLGVQNRSEVISYLGQVNAAQNMLLELATRTRRGSEKMKIDEILRKSQEIEKDLVVAAEKFKK